jgi:hypothetical protein
MQAVVQLVAFCDTVEQSLVCEGQGRYYAQISFLNSSHVNKHGEWGSTLHGGPNIQIVAISYYKFLSIIRHKGTVQYYD